MRSVRIVAVPDELVERFQGNRNGLQFCNEPGCGAIVPAGRCELHARPAWHHAAPTARVRGRRLQRMRSALFAEQPLCVACRAEGRTTVATIRDHIVPLEEGGADIESNCQALCQEHSDIKTARESARGRARWR